MITIESLVEHSSPPYLPIVDSACPKKLFTFLCSLKTMQGVLRKAIKLITEIRAPIRVWLNENIFKDIPRMIIFFKSRHVSWLSIIWTFCYPKMNEWSLITLSSWQWTMRKTGKAPSHHLSRAFISPSPQPPPYNKRRPLRRRESSQSTSRFLLFLLHSFFPRWIIAVQRCRIIIRQKKIEAAVIKFPSSVTTFFFWHAFLRRARARA